MRNKMIMAVLGGIVLTGLSGPPAPAAQAVVDPTGVWSSSYSAQQTADECGRWKLDDNGFCVADDLRNGLDVGMKFQTSRELEITGVRIYRVDPATVRASLWDSSGTLLARGTFAPSGGNGWQDVRFAAPVTITPGRTYIASYHTPGTKYAFDYGYFTDQARTVGPVTALRSGDDGPNGVHCYDGAPCESFPVRAFRDSTYFVTPLWQSAPGDAPAPADDPVITQQAPRVTAIVPAKGARRVKAAKTITATFSEPVRGASISRSTVFLLRKGSGRPVAATVRYDVKRKRVVLDPLAPLRAAASYRVVVTTEVRDLSGNRLDQTPAKPGRQRASFRFRTR